MPSSNDYLRNKFADFANGDGGEGKAEKVITDNGGIITPGFIIEIDLAAITDTAIYKDVVDAIDFLVYEWDYGYGLE